MDITKGSHITARHIGTGDLKHYRVVVERGRKDLFRLINLNSFYVMSGFKTENPADIIDYINKNLKCEIIKVSM